jgi:hypothetical protein
MWDFHHFGARFVHGLEGLGSSLEDSGFPPVRPFGQEVIGDGFYQIGHQPFSSQSRSRREVRHPMIEPVDRAFETSAVRGTAAADQGPQQVVGELVEKQFPGAILSVRVGGKM